MLLNISNIQHFSVGDGPGIRTTVFFKGCSLRCPWCHNPETLSAEPVTLRYPGRTEVCGKKVLPEEIMPELLADKAYFEESGGGVTFSGGEVLLQAEGAAELGALLKAEGVPVCVDTAGYAPYTAFEALNPYVDLYLYDFKTASAEKYEKIVGGNMALIRENLKQLLRGGKDVIVRIPLIPGFNMDGETTREICGALAEIGAKRVDLLPFHRLGSGKYRALGLEYAYADTKPPEKEDMDKLLAEYSRHFDARLDG